MAIRTAHLAGPQLVTNIAVVLYTCPAGKHVRVRTVHIVQNGTVSGDLSLALGDATVPANRFRDRQACPPKGANTNPTQLIEENIVLEEGTRVEAIATIPTGSIIVVFLEGTIYDN